MAAHRQKVLLVCANPQGSDPLRTAEEDRTLRESVQLARHASRIQIDSLHAATIDDLRRKTLRTQYQIVHFSGHGTRRGLIFEDAVGRVMVPSSEALAELLAHRGVETVIFNACYSLSAGRLAAGGVDYTIASDGPIADPAAIEFTRGFYDAVGEGLSIPQAYEEGMTAARLKGFRPTGVLLRKGEVHFGQQDVETSDLASRSHPPVTVGVALDTSGSMRESIRNETGGALSRIDGAQRAIKRLGQSVQAEVRKRSAATANGREGFRVFAFAFGLRHRQVADLFGLIRAARATDTTAEIERRKRAYTRDAEEEAARYGGLAKYARQQGLGGFVDSFTDARRAEAERSIRARIANEVADLLFSQADAAGDTVVSARELSELLEDDGRPGLAFDSLEPLLYGNTPMLAVAQAVRERFERVGATAEDERRILLVISDGDSTDGDPRRIFDDVRAAGVTIVSCFVTDRDVAEPRVLVSTPLREWEIGARVMFDIASPLNEDDALATHLLGEGWLLEPDAKLFVQVNHSEVLEEFVRAIGADVLHGAEALPEGR
jgi:CHAT domain